MQKPVSKNYQLEFYRFYFSIVVLLFHFKKYFFGLDSLKNGVHFSFFDHGSMAVEFFFLLSGFLMARTISQETAQIDYSFSSEQLSTDTLLYLKKKYFRIFPQHFVAFIITFIVFVFTRHIYGLRLLLLSLDNIPSFFLIQMSGLNLGAINHVTWYISCMLISMGMLYPLLKRHYYMITRVFGPLFACLMLGFLQATTGCITGAGAWMGVAYKSLFRSLSELALGATSYEISKTLLLWYKRSSMQSYIKLFSTLIEATCFGCFTIYCTTTGPAKYEVLCIPMAAILIIIAYNRMSYSIHLFKHRFILFLGSISLSIYLSQLSVIYIIQWYMQNHSNNNVVIIGCVMIVPISLFVYRFGLFLSKMTLFKKNKP